jgi:signal recognition particle receptor subunit beta
MPVIDPERDLLVLRIVYDGLPMSGKTTTVKALSQKLTAGSVFSPETVDGRTLYFDWFEYVGGLFEGRRICCQLVSVPGQDELQHRRRFILDSADAIVFVADSRPAELRNGLELLERLVPTCRDQEPPVGVVFQANRRDAPDAVEIGALRERLRAIAPMAVVETVALASEGVREAFVLAVRLALDRTRALAVQGRLAKARPREVAGGELFERLRTLELAESEPDDFTELERLLPGREASRAAPISASGEEVPFVPDPMMPSGQIWPPVDGRAWLHEVAGLGVSPTRTPQGDFWASGNGWRFHSAKASLFGDAYEGRRRLIDWARVHAAHADRISSRRALILVDTGSAGHRLWQLVHAESALRERLDAALAASVEVLGHELERVAEHLLEAENAFRRAGLRLRSTLWTVSGDLTQRPRFVGLMPISIDDAPPELEGAALLERELGPQLRELSRERADYPALQSFLRGRADSSLVRRTLGALS